MFIRYGYAIITLTLVIASSRLNAMHSPKALQTKECQLTEYLGKQAHDLIQLSSENESSINKIKHILLYIEKQNISVQFFENHKDDIALAFRSSITKKQTGAVAAFLHTALHADELRHRVHKNQQPSYIFTKYLLTQPDTSFYSPLMLAIAVEGDDPAIVNHILSVAERIHFSKEILEYQQPNHQAHWVSSLFTPLHVAITYHNNITSDILCTVLKYAHRARCFNSLINIKDVTGDTPFSLAEKKFTDIALKTLHISHNFFLT